jgi:hypothetical protein
MTSDVRKWLNGAASAVAIAAAGLSACGCQSEVGGQVLSSPYAAEDDVQYFAPGPEFKLSREAAAQKAYNAEQKLQQLRGAAAGP